MRSALHKAAASNDVAAAKELIGNSSADLNSLDEGLTPLVVAAAQGANGVLDLLLSDSRVDVNMPVVEGMTALHIAAGGLNYETVAKLVLAGADVNAKDINGTSPMMIAAENMMISQDHTALNLRIMVDSGRADPTATNADGCTCLHLAAYKGRLDIVEHLVARGWDAHALDDDGHTALHHSVAAWNLRGDPVVARYLVGLGVDTFAKNSSGQTALDVAAQNEHPKAVAFLREAMEEQRKMKGAPSP